VAAFLSYPSVRAARSPAALGFVLAGDAIALGVSGKYGVLIFSKKKCVVNSPSEKKAIISIYCWPNAKLVHVGITSGKVS